MSPGYSISPKAGLEGVWAETQMRPLTSSWSGTEAMDRGCVHRENDGLPKGQRMFAPQCLLPSTCLGFWLVAFGRHFGFSRVCDSVWDECCSGGSPPRYLGEELGRIWALGEVPCCSGAHCEGHEDWLLTSSCCRFTSFLRSRTLRVEGISCHQEGILPVELSVERDWELCGPHKACRSPHALTPGDWEEEVQTPLLLITVRMAALLPLRPGARHHRRCLTRVSSFIVYSNPIT